MRCFLITSCIKKQFKAYKDEEDPLIGEEVPFKSSRRLAPCPWMKREISVVSPSQSEGISLGVYDSSSSKRGNKNVAFVFF